MGRLLEALKRLESEMAALPPADPVDLLESPSVAAPDANRTTVLEPPAVWFEEVPVNKDTAADCPSAAETTDAEYRPYAEVTAEFDHLGELLDEKMPLFEEFSPNAECDPAVSAIAVAPPTDFLEPKTADEPEAVAGRFGFWQRSDDDIDPSEFIGVPESDKNSIFDADKPDAKKDRGAFGAMAKNVLAQLPGEEPAVLFFTSPTDGEGKTETILPLAEALIEESGRRTILVDANLHRPDLTREWRFTSRKGIFDVLAGDADWWEAVQETGLPKLSILLNNGLAPRQGIVAQPLAFSELLENLKREYRLVLIDGASLAHEETIPMVRYCQGVYLVVRLGHSRPRTVREARQIITRAGGYLLGCIAVGDVLAEV